MAVRIHPNDPPWPMEDQKPNDEVLTGVTVDEINELMIVASLTDWDRSPRRDLILWMEEAAAVFDRLLGHEETKPFGENDAAY